MVKHCKEAIDDWQESFPTSWEMRHIDIIRGNALEIHSNKGECGLGFDRIYIGAAIDRESLPSFKKLLKPGGILVGPGKSSKTCCVRDNPSRLSLLYVSEKLRTNL